MFTGVIESLFDRIFYIEKWDRKQSHSELSLSGPVSNSNCLKILISDFFLKIIPNFCKRWLRLFSFQRNHLVVHQICLPLNIFVQACTAAFSAHSNLLYDNNNYANGTTICTSLQDLQVLLFYFFLTFGFLQLDKNIFYHPLYLHNQFKLCAGLSKGLRSVLAPLPDYFSSTFLR